jgi:hypothetical protein
MSTNVSYRRLRVDDKDNGLILTFSFKYWNERCGCKNNTHPQICSCTHVLFHVPTFARRVSFIRMIMLDLITSFVYGSLKTLTYSKASNDRMISE